MKRARRSNGNYGSADWSPDTLGLDPKRYKAVLRHLFDRPIPSEKAQEWYWDDAQAEFDATPLEWTRFQTAIFGNAATDLQEFGDEQIGMGLRYLADNGLSDFPFAAIHATVPLNESMRMLRAMPNLWRGCFGPRLLSQHSPIGSATGGRLGNICYMWFDVWPTFYRVRDQAPWRDALWQALTEILAVPCREAQISALHGIGHEGRYLDRQQMIDDVLKSFVGGLSEGDHELRAYAEAARLGRVQ